MASIRIAKAADRIVVQAAGTRLAETRNALELFEGAQPGILYLPRSDVDMRHLERSETTTFCPYKGTANYYAIKLSGERMADAVWTYEAPLDTVAEIKDHLAFYQTKVEIKRG